MRRRQTKQRSMILDELRARTDHPTADDLYADLRKEMPTISLGTVYRNLDVLSAEGLIRVISTPGQPRRFDGNVGPHDHVRCVVCGKFFDLPTGYLPGTENIKIPGFTVTRCSIEVEGVCWQCSGESEKKSGH